MKNLYIFFSILSILLSGGTTSAQTFEFAEQLWGNNSFNSAISVNDSLWVITNKGSQASYLRAFNSEGIELWTFDASTLVDAAINEYLDVAQMNDSTIVVLTYWQESCDIIIEDMPLYILRFDLEGNFLGSTEVPWTNPGSAFIAGGDGHFYYPVNYPDSTSLTSFDSNGDSEWTFSTEDNYLLEVIAKNNNVFVFLTNMMIKLDIDGVPVDTLNYSFSPNGAAVLDNGSVAVTDGLGVTLYSPEYEFIASYVLIDQSFTTIKTDNDGIMALMENEIFFFNASLEIVDQIGFSAIPGFNINDIACSENALLLAGYKSSDPDPIFNFNHYHHYPALRTILKNGTELQHDPDLEITSVSITNLAYQPSPSGIFTASANVTVRNSGDVPVQNFYLNYIYGPNFCGPLIYSQNYTETLAPGDEIELEFQNFSGLTASLNDTVNFNICIFATAPDNYIDRQLSNDKFCAPYQIILDVAEPSLSDNLILYPNPAAEFITIQGSFSERLRYTIYSVQGRKLMDGYLGGISKIDIRALDTGFYFLSMGDQQKRVLKFFKE